MANSELQLLFGSLLLCLSGIAVAETEEDDGPDIAFLEYLGMWEESDEDWLLIEEQVVAGNDERSDPVPEGEESVETEDES